MRQIGITLCCVWSERYRLPLPKGLLCRLATIVLSFSRTGLIGTPDWLKCIKPTGAFVSVYRPTNTLTYVDMFTSSPCRLQRTSRVSVKTSCKNWSGAKTLGDCVLAVISGTFWTMLNHCDLDFLSILHQIWTCVRRSGGSMKLSVQTGKQSTYFLLWFYFIFLFVVPKCLDSCEWRLLALWNIALRIVVCWTLSFSKSWNSFQVFFCS